MAQGNHFLTIPTQEGLFTTIKSGRAGEAHDDSPVEDEDEEENEEDVRFIPRCSPVPRKRGPSITDETAEYMRIRLALPQRRVSFADAAGAELVDVREFVAFDSGDEEDEAAWEEEEAKCRRAYLQPVYRVWPEFEARAGRDLALAVQANKVEVEKVTAVQDEPLSFDALICVLNVSYHKCVSVRSTMDGWITYCDSAAEYVQDSHDGDTDKFLARLCFAEPYLFSGARIDFVVRYETSDGEFWANNSGRNYSVTLVVSHEEETGPDNKVEDREIKGILKPPRYRVEDDSDFCPDTDDGNEDNTETEAAAEIPSSVCPLVIEPEIDIEIPEASVSPSKTREDTIIPECPLLSAERQDEHPPHGLPENPPQTDHLEKGQDTDLLVPTEKITVSFQNDPDPDNDPTLNTDRLLHSVESKQPFCPNQDKLQSDTAVQVHSALDITLPAVFPSIQNMGGDVLEALIKHTDDDEIQPGERRVAQLQDQSTDTMDVHNTESLLPELQESTQGDFSDSTGNDILFEESHQPLLAKPEMQMIEHDTMVRRESNGKEQTGLWLGEVPDMIASCMWQPFEPTDLGQTREESIIQNVPRPDPEVTEHQHQAQGPEPELKKSLPEVLSGNVDTPSDSEHTESPMLTSISRATATSQSLTTTVRAMAPAPEGGDGEPSMTQEEPLSNEEFEWYSEDPASFQKQGGLESEPALRCKTIEASNVKVDVILGKTLIPSFAFLSATVCLIVGFHEPSIFLIMALFLVSLCF